MNWSAQPFSKALLLAIFGVAATFCFAWSFGGAQVFPWQWLWPPAGGLIDSDLQGKILFSIRLPRILCACLVGGALAVAGVMTQGLFRNSLASPSVLGISSGGTLGAILAFYYGLDIWGFWSLPLFALIGCLLITGLILHFAGATQSFAIEDLLLIGFALNGILSAVSSFVLSLALSDFEKGPAMVNWMLGTLNGKTWEHFQLGCIPIGLGILLSHRLAYRLNLISLGLEVAQSLGIELKRLRLQIVLLVALLVATSVSIGGLMPFIGLIVPHFSRIMVGPDHRHLLSISALNGMTLVMLADFVARIAMPPREIQVGVIISMLGSTFFLWILYQRRRSSNW